MKPVKDARTPLTLHLTRRESQIMEILHRRQRAPVEEIRDELPDASSPSSVRKLLDHDRPRAAGP